MATDAAHKHLEVALQEEMCRMFSSEFEGIDTRELTPFVAVMRMIKLEYAYSNPQLYKMLVTVLHDYNPSLGTQHRQMTVKYIRMLLDRSPELADYLVNILPPSATCPASLTAPQHALHALKVTKSGDRGVGKMSIAPDKTFGGKALKEEPKYYNCTTPALSAFVANQGVPSKFVTQASRQPPVPRTWTASESQSDAQTMLATATSVKPGPPSFPLTQGGTVQLLPGSKLVLRSQEGQEVMLAGSATRIQRLPNATVTHVKVPISPASRGAPIAMTSAPSVVVTTMGTPINVHNMAAFKVSPRKHSITLNTSASKLKGVQVSELKGDSSTKESNRKQHLFEKQLHLIKATDILSRREDTATTPTGSNSDNTRVALRAKIRERTGAPTMTFSTSITSSPQAGPSVSSTRRMQDFGGIVPTLVLPHPASKKASSDRSLSSFPYGQHFTAKMVTEETSDKDNRFVSDDPLKALQRAANLPTNAAKQHGKGQSTKDERVKMFTSTSRIVQEESISSSSTNVSTQSMNVDQEETTSQGSSQASADPETESSQYMEDEVMVLEYIAGRRRHHQRRRQYMEALLSASESPSSQADRDRQEAGSSVSASDLEESSSCASQSPTFSGPPKPQPQGVTGFQESTPTLTPTPTPSLWQYHPQAQAQTQPPALPVFQMSDAGMEKKKKKKAKSGSLKRKRGKE